MSQESVRAFIEKMKTDEAFREKVMAVDDVDGRIALARACGFDFTVEELRAAGEDADAIADVEGQWCCGGQDCRSQDTAIKV